MYSKPTHATLELGSECVWSPANTSRNLAVLTPQHYRYDYAHRLHVLRQSRHLDIV
jgi:hypothetical protein